MILSNGPVCLSILSYSIHWFGLFIILGLCSYAVALWFDSERRNVISMQMIWQLAVEGVWLGYISARLMFVLLAWSYFSRRPWEALYIWQGGGCLQGALLALVPFLGWRLYNWRLPVLRSLDILFAYAPILQVAGRLGCLFSGCCYGKVAALDSWLSVTYTSFDSLAPRAVALLPAQLYALGMSLAIFFVLQGVRWFYSGLPFGSIVCFYLILESSARFVIDFFRDQSQESLFLVLGVGLTLYQILACIIMMLGAIGIGYLHLNRWGRQHDDAGI